MGCAQSLAFALLYRTVLKATGATASCNGGLQRAHGWLQRSESGVDLRGCRGYFESAPTRWLMMTHTAPSRVRDHKLRDVAVPASVSLPQLGLPLQTRCSIARRCLMRLVNEHLSLTCFSHRPSLVALRMQKCKTSALVCNFIMMKVEGGTTIRTAAASAA